MEIARIVLEYLRVLLSAPVMSVAVIMTFLFLFREDLKALLLRVAKIRFPGGTELSTLQSERQHREAEEAEKPVPTPAETPWCTGRSRYLIGYRTCRNPFRSIFTIRSGCP